MGARLLEVVGEQQAAGPVAILIDDLQWADRKSVEALTFMLRRLSVDPVLAMVIYRGTGDRLDETAQRMLVSVENRLHDIAGRAAAGRGRGAGGRAHGGTAGRRGRPAAVQGHRRASAVPAHGAERGVRLRSAGARAAALPRSLAAAIGDHLRVLPPETRAILEMLAVLNLRMPLAQLGQAAQVGSPSAAIEPAVASGLVDWWPEEPTCPVEIRHLLVRDAIYAAITATRRRVLHARAAAVVSESASWEHRVAALDRPDEDLAAELERLAGEEAAGGRLALAATHLQWASDISPARADRERRLLTAALHLMLAEESRGLALREAVEAASPSPLRSCVLGTMAFSSGQLAEAERRFSRGAGAGAGRPGQPAAGRPDRQPAGGHLHAAGRRGEGDGLRAAGAGHRHAWTRRPRARPAP